MEVAVRKYILLLVYSSHITIICENEALNGLKAVESREITPKLNPPSLPGSAVALLRPGERLRRGSCRFPSYVKTSEDRPTKLYAEYGQRRRISQA